MPVEGIRLDILVENMGRINYGPYLYDPKGITEGVRLERQFLFNWPIYSLPLNNLNKLMFEGTNENSLDEPRFYRGFFEAEELGDTFIELPGWTKGVVFINGFNIGGYWKIGPQKTLYIPGSLLKEGKNEVIVFELHGTSKPEIVLSGTQS